MSRLEIFCGVCGDPSHTDRFHTKVKCVCGVINVTSANLRSCWDCRRPLVIPELARAMPASHSGVKRVAEETNGRSYPETNGRNYLEPDCRSYPDPPAKRACC